MRIVLVRPRDPNNIGAAARAMANFGFEDLVLVAPWEPVVVEARSAVGASSVLASAAVVPVFRDALVGRSWVVGTTAGTRRVLANLETVESVFEKVAGGGAGVLADMCLVFGDEKRGLTNEELALCTSIARIPTLGGQPSMNLGQAVAVCCYEAARWMGGTAVDGVSMPRRRERRATVLEIEYFLSRVIEPHEDERIEARRRAARDRIRRLFRDGELSHADLALIEGLTRAR